MTKQRVAVLIAAILGAIATFLPWVKAPIIGSIDGTGGDGWFSLGLFAIPILICTLGNSSKNFSTGATIGVVVSAILAVGLGMWKIADFKAILSRKEVTQNYYDNLISEGFTIGAGIYLIIIAGVLVILFALALGGSKKT